MFLTAKLNLLSGVAIGAGAVLLMKQCCRQKKQHQKTTKHHSSKVANPRDGETSAQAMLVASNNGPASFLLQQKHLWLQPIKFNCLRSLLGRSQSIILSNSASCLSISQMQEKQPTQVCEQGSKTNPCAKKWWLRPKFDCPHRYYFRSYFPSILQL